MPIIIAIKKNPGSLSLRCVNVEIREWHTKVTAFGSIGLLKKIHSLYTSGIPGKYNERARSGPSHHASSVTSCTSRTSRTAQGLIERTCVVSGALLDRARAVGVAGVANRRAVRHSRGVRGNARRVGAPSPHSTSSSELQAEPS